MGRPRVPRFRTVRAALDILHADHTLTPVHATDRLRINDKPDPYVAVYTPPSPSRTGDLVHVRWTGLLGPAFVQSVVDAAM